MFSWPPSELEGQALLLNLQGVPATVVLTFSLPTAFRWLLGRGEFWGQAAL